MSDNPYESPSDAGLGIYDYSLFWRIVKFFVWFSFALALVDLVLYLQFANSSYYADSETPSMLKFFFNFDYLHEMYKRSPW